MKKIEKIAEEKYPKKWRHRTAAEMVEVFDENYQLRTGFIDGYKSSPTGDRDCEELKEALREIIELKSKAGSTQELFPVLQAIDKAKQLLNKHP